MSTPYNVITRTHACPSCKAVVVVRTYVEEPVYVEAPLRPCPKCKAEVLVGDCNEWELLSPSERSEYWFGLARSAGLAIIPMFIAVAFLVGVFLLLDVPDLARRFMDWERDPNHVALGKRYNPVPYALGGGATAVLLWIAFWTGKHIYTVAASKRRMADPAYRARVLAL